MWTDSAGHNIFARGDNLFFRVDYENGVRAEDCAGAASGKCLELGFFDSCPSIDNGYNASQTTPEDNCQTMNSPPTYNCEFSYGWGGLWGAYIFFPSGLIAVGGSGPPGGTFILNYTGPLSGYHGKRRA